MVSPIENTTKLGLKMGYYTIRAEVMQKSLFARLDKSEPHW